MSVNPFEFQQARVKQVLFKSRLRSAIYGVRAADADLCALPSNPLHQWIEQYLRPQLGNTAEVRQLDQALARMLQRGDALLEHYRHGRLEEARTGLSGIETDATEIDKLLTALERSAAGAQA